MADIPLSKISGGSVLPKLAPDLSFPGNLVNGAGFFAINGIDATGGLTTALSLSGGAFSVSLLEFTSTASENITIKLTVDGVVVWNDTFANASSSIKLLGAKEATVSGVVSEIQCDDSFLLEIQTTADNAVNLNYLARPIL